MVIFNNYVSLPEGIMWDLPHAIWGMVQTPPIFWRWFTALQYVSLPEAICGLKTFTFKTLHALPSGITRG